MPEAQRAPAHYDIALRELGTREIAGSGSNSRIDEYLHTVGLSDDETPWCAAFVNYCLREAGTPGTNSGSARSYEKWGVGVPITDANRGDIVVFKRGSKSWQGHVAFVEHLFNGKVRCLGGNQSDAVKFADFNMADIVAVRRPKKLRDSTTVVAGGGVIASKVAEKAVDIAADTVSVSVSAAPEAVADVVVAATDVVKDAAADPVVTTAVSQAQDLLPFISNGNIKMILATISVALVMYIIFERVKRLMNKGD